MRTCPVCDSNSVPLSALIAVAVNSTGRCGACGSGLRFNGARDLLGVVAFAVALGTGLLSGSVWLAAIAGGAAWSLVLAAPLEPDETDPITFRRLLRKSRNETP